MGEHEHVIEMVFATHDHYPGSRRGAAIQRDADKAIAAQNLPYQVRCDRVNMFNDPNSGGLVVRVIYHEVIDEVS